jgi:hypothetical protein
MICHLEPFGKAQGRLRELDLGNPTISIVAINSQENPGGINAVAKN